VQTIIQQLAKLDSYRIYDQVTELVNFNKLAIETVIDREKPQSLCFPGDGNGIGLTIAKEKGIPCVSGDIYPRFPGVQAEEWQETVRRSDPKALVIFSRVLNLVVYDETVMGERKSVAIDRHKVMGCYRGSDPLITTNVKMPSLNIKTMDKVECLAVAEIPHFINNYRPEYKMEVSDDQLESVVRFIKLHGWKVALNVPLRQRPMLKSYGIKLSSTEQNLIADSPFASIDYYSGIASEHRVFVNGLPRRMSINETAVIKDEIIEPIEGVYSDGEFYYLRFKEVGWYHVKFKKPQERKNKTLISTFVVEVVKAEGSQEMVFGNGRRESYDVVRQEGIKYFVKI
jgi:hypothetical protein